MEKNKLKQILLISKITLTIASLFLFLVWLMFMTNNFFPKSQNSFVAKIMNTSIQIMIWPITSIILFIFIMPIWVTNKKEILLVFLTLSLIITILCSTFLFSLNINKFWIIWLIAHFFAIASIIFVFFSFFFKEKLLLFKKEKNKHIEKKGSVPKMSITTHFP
ncbi:hypothetical protein [Spiroplasma ixodetis]|uniref:hypothetical protein n=1 Tax=Spiroplasma ixodetis TaxID=2141 RepID=UPI00248F923D|nr:hypothetical protein [Spiroplasma ixodetis]